jgi:hypothetical protein
MANRSMSFGAFRAIAGVGFVVVLSGFVLLFSGCQTVRGVWARRPWRKPVVAIAMDYAPRLGVVASVNGPLKFVLVDCGTAPVPSKGRELRVYRDGAIVAELTATSRVKRPYLLADIAAGNPGVGDAVMQLGTGWVGSEGAEALRGSSEKARAEAFAGDPVIAGQPARAASSLFRRGGTEEGIEAVPVGSPARLLLPAVGSDWFLPGR